MVDLIFFKMSIMCLKATVSLFLFLNGLIIFQPGGGQVKISTRKLEWNAAPKTSVLNEGYVPGGGDKKVSNFFSEEISCSLYITSM